MLIWFAYKTMTKEELQKLREDMLAEKNLLETELGKIAVKNPLVEGDYQAKFDKTDTSATPEEKANSIMDFEERRAVEQNFELRLKEINDTLKRIDDGKYGICEHCGSTIEGKRLKAVIAAKYCMDCAQRADLI